MENISLRILRICIFVYATEFQNIQLLSVPQPCPDIAQRETIADMCTSDNANEGPKNGGLTIDSVALRVMTQQDGCTCRVSLENHSNSYTVYMRKYDLLTSAGPEHEACGLAIDIDYISPENFPENKDSIECTKGINTRSVSLSQNGVLNFKSRIIGGNFSRGYCIQIYRQHTTGNDVHIKINCSLSNMPTTEQDKTVSSILQTTQHMTDAVIQDKTVSSNMQTTQHMTDADILDDTVASNMQTTQQSTNAAFEDKTVSDTNSTLFIGIGVGSAVVVISLFVAVAVIIIRRKSNKNKNGNEGQPNIECTDDDSDGLKYNCLYDTSEQNILEGNYHTVDIEKKQNPGIQNFDSDYSTVDGNYSSVDIVHMATKDGSKTDNRIKSSSTTKPRSETQRTKEERSNDLKHVTAGSNAEYAVVDKSDRTDQNIKHVNATNDSNVEYAVVDKKKA